MSYGRLSPAQRHVLKRFIARRVVHDLGAGDLGVAMELLNLRAASIVAVDELLFTSPTPRITCVKSPFSGFTKPVRTAFVSWPWASQIPGLVPILKGAPTVIYLGSNLDGSACGGRDLWEHFVTRRVLAHEPHRTNTLIVYGKTSPVMRELLPEETAAFDIRKMHRFDDVYGKERPCPTTRSSSTISKPRTSPTSRP